MTADRDPAAPRALIVRRYAIKRFVGWTPEHEAELRRGNALWNALVEVDRTNLAAWHAIWRDFPAVAAAEAQLAAAEDALAEARTKYRQARAATRSRRVDEDVRVQVKACIDDCKAGRAALGAARAAARQSADWPAAERRFAELAAALETAVRRTVDDAGVFYDTAGAIVRAWRVARRRVIALRMQHRRAALRFHRFGDDGRFVNQLKGGGTPLPQFLAGARPASLAGNKLEMTALSRFDRDAPRGEAKPRLRSVRQRDGSVVQREEMVRGPRRGERVPLTAELNLHRPIVPSSATEAQAEIRVKQVQVTLRANPDYHPLMPAHERLLARDLHAVVTMEAPARIASDAPRRPREAAIAVNLGWRHLDDEIWRMRHHLQPGLRVAALAAASGRVLIITAPGGERCMREALADPGFVVLPPAMLTLDTLARQRRGERDELRERIVPRLRLVPWRDAPDGIAQFGAQLAAAPRCGFRVLARLVIQWQMTAPDWRPAELAAFEAWRREDKRLRSEEEALRRRFVGRRRNLYRCVAKQLAERAAVILLDKADFADLARLPADGDPALEQVARYRRVLAAPGELRLAIHHAAARAGRSVVLQDGPSTWICPVGGEQLKPPFPADLTYFCGKHRVMLDQDVANCQVRLQRWRDSGGAEPQEVAAPLAAK